MKTLMIWLIKIYQSTISLFIGPSCRYTPSCSNYMKEGVLQKGLLKGLGLGIWRILRCHPFSKGGYDPV